MSPPRRWTTVAAVGLLALAYGAVRLAGNGGAAGRRLRRPASPAAGPGRADQGSTGAGPAAPWRIALASAGVLAMVYGLLRLLTGGHATNPRYALTWLVGGALVHDLVLVPLVLLAAVLILRRVAPPYRAVFQAGLLSVGTLVAVAYPVLSGKGRKGDNSSVDPLPYGRNLLVVLAAVAVTTALAALIVRLRRPPGRAGQGTARGTAPVRSRTEAVPGR